MAGIQPLMLQHMAAPAAAVANAAQLGPKCSIAWQPKKYLLNIKPQHRDCADILGTLPNSVVQPLRHPRSSAARPRHRSAPPRACVAGSPLPSPPVAEVEEEELMEDQVMEDQEEV